MALLSEFKEFAMRGNAVDMAVGIVIGASFNRVIQSLVNDVIMPPIGLLIGGMPFKELAIVLKDQVVSETGEVVTPAVQISYGLFINNIIDFLIVAFVVFLVVRLMNRIIRKREAIAPPA